MFEYLTLEAELAKAEARAKALEADRDQISLTLDVAKADRDKWFNRARDLEAELATWRQIGTSNAARIEGLEAALRACTEKGANIHVIARDALTPAETTVKHEPRIRHQDMECHCSCGGPWPCPEMSVEPVANAGQLCALCNHVHDLMSACPPSDRGEKHE